MVLWMKWNKSGRNLVVWMMPLFFVLFGVVRLWQEQRQVEMWEKFMETCEGEEREIYGKIIAMMVKPPYRKKNLRINSFTYPKVLFILVACTTAHLIEKKQRL